MRAAEVAQRADDDSDTCSPAVLGAGPERVPVAGYTVAEAEAAGGVRRDGGVAALEPGRSSASAAASAGAYFFSLASAQAGALALTAAPTTSTASTAQAAAEMPVSVTLSAAADPTPSPTPSSSSSAPESAPPPSSSPSPSAYSPPPGAQSAVATPQLTSFERWAARRSDSQFNALSGAVGGFTSGMVTCPLDVIKTKLQAQGGFIRRGGQATKVYKGLFGTASVILRDEGVRGLYRGLGPIILGYLPTWAVWFTVYNKSKVWMGEHYHNNYVISFWSSLLAGGSSTIVTNPIWVIKTRLMSQMPAPDEPRGNNTPTSRPGLHTPWHYRSTLDAARKMYTTEGILSFYSGLTPALLGLSHVAVQFPAYEFLKTRFTGRGMGSSGRRDEAPPHWFGVLSATILSKVLASSLTYPHEVIRTRLQTQRRPTAAALSRQLASGMGATGAGVLVPPVASAEIAAAEAAPRYHGVITTFRTILREEGWRAFYSGLGTNLMRAVPAATVTMMTYEYVMQQLTRTRHDAREKLGLAER